MSIWRRDPPWRPAGSPRTPVQTWAPAAWGSNECVAACMSMTDDSALRHAGIITLSFILVLNYWCLHSRCLLEVQGADEPQRAPGGRGRSGRRCWGLGAGAGLTLTQLTLTVASFQTSQTLMFKSISLFLEVIVVVVRAASQPHFYWKSGRGYSQVSTMTETTASFDFAETIMSYSFSWLGYLEGWATSKKKKNPLKINFA